MEGEDFGYEANLRIGRLEAELQELKDEYAAYIRWVINCPLRPPCDHKCGALNNDIPDLCYCGYVQWLADKPEAKL